MSDRIESAVMALARRLSGWGVVAVASAIYGGGGLALPLLMQWPMWALVEANIVSTVIAGALLVAWSVLRLEERDRRHLVEWTTNLRLLNAEEFEWFVGEVFRREGWEVRETGRTDGPDGNIDLELSRRGERRIVQCKRWTSWLVGIDEVRKLGGTLLRESLPGSAGVLVALSGFTPAAEDEAKRIRIELVGSRDLLRRAEKVRRREPCPQCGAPMVLDRSVRGWWFRCMANGCQGKRDLGSDAGGAIGLLTEPSERRS